MKRLHTFNLIETLEEEVEITKKDESGADIKVKEKVKKEIPHTYFVARPTRKQREDASFFYGAKLSYAIKRGDFLTIPMLEKRYANDGSIFSEAEQEKRTNLYVKLLELSGDYEKLNPKTDKTEDDNKRIEEIKREIVKIESELKSYEAFKLSLYDSTAEVWARNATISWWLMHLCYEEKDGKEINFWGDGDFDKRMARFDEIFESDSAFLNNAIEYFQFFVTVWAINQIEDPKDFKELEEKFSAERSATQ